MDTQVTFNVFSVGRSFQNLGRWTDLALIALLSVTVLTAVPTVYGDLLQGQREAIAASNGSYDTFKVGPASLSYNETLSPYMLFNEAAEVVNGSIANYGLASQGVSTYNAAAAQQFYDERAIKSFVSTWTVSDDSKMIGAYRTADLAHTVTLTGADGGEWSKFFGQGADPTNHYYNTPTSQSWRNSLQNSESVGITGDVNFSLTASWTTNASNTDPVWATGLTDNNKWALRNLKDHIYGDYSETVYGDQLNGGVINMIAYDVTDLVRALGYDVENAYMFTWEDWDWDTLVGQNNVDFDYNDMVFILTNVTPNFTNTETPEPATMLIFGLGAVGIGLARRRLR